MPGLTESEFKYAWEALKAQGPPACPVRFPCADGVTWWLLPAGIAHGAEWSTNVAFRTHARVQAATRGPHHLWAQEQMIYLRERSTALARAMEELDKVVPRPRAPEHAVNDPRPYPEDFGFAAYIERHKKKVGEA
jgi:hypothetical protein